MNTPNHLTLFTHEAFGEIRTQVVDGKPYFVGKDVAIALGYTNSRKAIGDHCKGVTKRYLFTSTGEKEVSFIPQSDVIRLVMRSKLPSAEVFQDWVCEEVIPAILQTGSYALPGLELPAPPVADSLARHIASFQIGTHGPALDLERLIRLHVEITQPAAEASTRREIHPEIAKLAPTTPEVTEPFPLFLGDYYLSIGQRKACRVTVAQLLAHGAPISHQLKDRRKACGNHLRHWVGRAFRPYGCPDTLTVTRQRTARSRSYLIQPYYQTQTPAYVPAAQ